MAFDTKILGQSGQDKQVTLNAIYSVDEYIDSLSQTPIYTDIVALRRQIPYTQQQVESVANVLSTLVNFYTSSSLIGDHVLDEPIARMAQLLLPDQFQHVLKRAQAMVTMRGQYNKDILFQALQKHIKTTLSQNEESKSSNDLTEVDPRSRQTLLHLFCLADQNPEVPDAVRLSFELIPNFPQHLIQKGVDPNATDILGNTALIYACKTASLKTVKILVDGGAKINFTANPHKITPLHIVCSYNRLDILNLFLQHHVNLDPLDDEGSTPLHHACFSGHIDIVKQLIIAKASLNIADNEGKTPMKIAEERGHEEIRQLLMNKMVADGTKQAFGRIFDFLSSGDNPRLLAVTAMKAVVDNAEKNKKK